VSEKCTQDLVSAFTDREQAAGIHGLGRQQCLRQELLKFIIVTHSFSAIFFWEIATSAHTPIIQPILSFLPQ